MPSVPLDPDGAGPPAEPPGKIASLFPIERARLTELLAGLEHADWERPSPCPGWTVLGLCCHLVGDDLSVLSRHRAEQAWRLLANNLPSAQRARLAASGDAAILGILYQTRAIIGLPT